MRVILLISGESLSVILWTMSFMNMLKNVGLRVLRCCIPLRSAAAGHVPFKTLACNLEFVYMF